jgi:pimeloyl-ACP methyl ester carboxylesterase
MSRCVHDTRGARSALGTLIALALGGSMGMASDDASLTEGFARTADGLRVAYEIRGEGEDVLIVPLACWTARELEGLARGRRVVFYDPRGRGRSDTLRSESLVGIEADVADLEALRAHLELERFSILGWSYYGGMAARYAIAHPERVIRLIQVSPLPARRTPYFEQGAAAVAARIDAAATARVRRLAESGGAAADPAQFCRAWYEAVLPAYVASKEALGRMRSDPCAHPNESPLTVQAMLQRVWQSLGDWDWRKEVAAMSVPQLTIMGDKDFQSAEGTREWVSRPGAALLVVSGAGHAVWLDRPDAFAGAVDTFLEGRLPEGAELRTSR